MSNHDEPNAQAFGLTEQTDAAEVEGVWMVGHFDWNWITESVHESELEALRIVNGRGYGEVHFLPFGMETWEASHAARAAVVAARGAEDGA